MSVSAKRRASFCETPCRFLRNDRASSAKRFFEVDGVIVEHFYETQSRSARRLCQTLFLPILQEATEQDLDGARKEAAAGDSYS